MGKRILLLSGSAPPAVTGSAVIVSNLAQQFTREEMVVAGFRSPGPPLQWREQWPPVIHLQRVFPYTRRYIRELRKLKIPLLIAQCVRLIKRMDVESVVVVYPEADVLLAGYLAAKITGTRLFGYFHNTYLEQSQFAGRGARFARWFQKRFFRRAEHVFVMSRGMQELFEERYPGLSCSPLLHTFNEPIPPFEPTPPPGETLELLSCGSVLNACCLDASCRFSAAVAGMKNVRLSLVTGVSAERLKAAGMLTEGVTAETLPRDQVPQRLRAADILLLPHGLTGTLSPEEYRTIFPTRTIEYLIAGRPILAHSPPGVFLTRFLKEHDCALVVEEPDTGAIQAAIRRLREDGPLRDRLVRNALKAAEQFQAPRVAAELRRRLQQNSA